SRALVPPDTGNDCQRAVALILQVAVALPSWRGGGRGAPRSPSRPWPPASRKSTAKPASAWVPVRRGAAARRGRGFPGGAVPWPPWLWPAPLPGTRLPIAPAHRPRFPAGAWRPCARACVAEFPAGARSRATPAARVRFLLRQGSGGQMRLLFLRRVARSFGEARLHGGACAPACYVGVSWHSCSYSGYGGPFHPRAV